MQQADLGLDPSEKTLNYMISHSKRVLEQIIAAKEIDVLHLNLRMLQRQGLNLNAVTRSNEFEYEMLVSLKDDESSLLRVWPFVDLKTIEQFREQFPQLLCVSKSQDELLWE